MTGLPASLRLPRKPAGTARQGSGRDRAGSTNGRWPRAPRVRSSRPARHTCSSRHRSGRPLLGTAYEVDGYLSPLFSPLIRPDWLPAWISPGLLILWIPLGFRATCYYYRKAYYRFYFADPPGCAVGEPPSTVATPWSLAFPFILQNLHRFFLYLAFIPLFFLWVDAVASLVPDERTAAGPRRRHPLRQRHPADRLLAVVPLASARRRRAPRLLLLHAANRVQHTLWRRLTSLNVHHMAWAWVSLSSVALADVYVRLMALGVDHRSGDPFLAANRHAGSDQTPATRPRRPRHRRRRCRPPGRHRGQGERRRRGLVCKSLLGKAHTVMAEGGVAAALAHVAPSDSWQTHFRDTMVGGKLLNNPRMAQLHAMEAPDRVRELEKWGAVFDRTEDGRILQRPFGGHSHPRLAHVGDRTGLEMIRTLQDRAVAAGIKVYMECTITRLITGARWGARGVRLLADERAIRSPSRPRRSSWRPAGSATPTRSPRTPGSTAATARRWPTRPGAELIDMEFVQFHPTGMVWPPGVRGLLVTEAVRGEGGILRNASGERFMWKYLPEERRAEYAATDEEAARWVTALSQGRETDARRPPELSTRDNVARAIYTEVKEGRGSPHGGVFLDISYLPADHVRRKLPSMYDQFKELADVDITKGPMEVGPTTHYVMGGIRVDAETGATTIRGLYAAGEVAGGMHGANRLGGNSLSDLLVFGARTGAAAAQHASTQASEPHLDPVQVQGASRALAAALERADGEDPYAIQRDLQEMMGRLVGIFRIEADLDEAIVALADLRKRWANVRATGGRAYNPGWNLVFELGNLLTVSEAVARSALLRTESRGAHSRLDHPATDEAKWNAAEHRGCPDPGRQP